MGVYDHPHYYDIAVSWDVSLERDFILDCFSHHCSRPVRSLLDVACGSGRLCREFGRLGMEASGLDKSEAMVAYARRALGDAAAGGRLVVADMAGFELGRTFDAVICMLDSLAHIGSVGRLASHLAAVRRHLEVGGIYVVDFVVASGVQESWTLERDGTTVTCHYSSSRAEAGSYRQEITFVVRHPDGREERIESTDVCPVLRPDEFLRLAEAAGMRNVASFAEHDLHTAFAFGKDRRFLGAFVAE